MLTKLKRKIYKFLHPIKGEVWCLHRVVPVRSKCRANRGLEITPNFLKSKLLEYKQKGYQFVSINEIQKDLSCFFAKKCLNVSFDDGFSDVYHYAFPILKEYRVPFTLYLTADFPEKKALIWWILLEEIIWDTEKLTLLNGTIYDCSDDKKKNTVYDELSKQIFTSEKNSFLIFAELFPQETTDRYFLYCQSLMLNWGQIKEMKDSGLCEIGSHSVSHSILTKLPEEEAFFELIESKRIIEDKINKTVSHFSYPNSSCNEILEKLVEKAGYKTATMGFGGVIRLGDNKYKLPRNYIVQ